MAIHHHTPLVLASGSAIRAQMLKSAGLHFSVVPGSVNEEEIKADPALAGQKPETLAAALARAKALCVARDYPEHVTIGADQVCVLNETIFDKPASRQRAIEQLQQLAGQTHRQISAVCLARGQEVIWEHSQQAELTMRPLSLREIEAYVEADTPLKSCGAYCYESLGRHLFTQVTGSEDVIKGLPLQAIIARLHAMEAIGLD